MPTSHFLKDLVENIYRMINLQIMVDSRRSNTWLSSLFHPVRLLRHIIIIILHTWRAAMAVLFELPFWLQRFS